jgi:hypothetical protein
MDHDVGTYYSPRQVPVDIQWEHVVGTWSWWEHELGEIETENNMGT